MCSHVKDPALVIAIWCHCSLSASLFPVSTVVICLPDPCQCCATQHGDVRAQPLHKPLSPPVLKHIYRDQVCTVSQAVPLCPTVLLNLRQWGSLRTVLEMLLPANLLMVMPTKFLSCLSPHQSFHVLLTQLSKQHLFCLAVRLQSSFDNSSRYLRSLLSSGHYFCASYAKHWMWLT